MKHNNVRQLNSPSPQVVEQVCGWRRPGYTESTTVTAAECAKLHHAFSELQNAKLKILQRSFVSDALTVSAPTDFLDWQDHSSLIHPHQIHCSTVGVSSPRCTFHKTFHSFHFRSQFSDYFYQTCISIFSQIPFPNRLLVAF